MEPRYFKNSFIASYFYLFNFFSDHKLSHFLPTNKIFRLKFSYFQEKNIIYLSFINKLFLALKNLYKKKPCLDLFRTFARDNLKQRLCNFQELIEL